MCIRDTVWFGVHVQSAYNHKSVNISLQRWWVLIVACSFVFFSFSVYLWIFFQPFGYWLPRFVHRYKPWKRNTTTTAKINEKTQKANQNECMLARTMSLVLFLLLLFFLFIFSSLSDFYMCIGQPYTHGRHRSMFEYFFRLSPIYQKPPFIVSKHRRVCVPCVRVYARCYWVRV